MINWLIDNKILWLQNYYFININTFQQKNVILLVISSLWIFPIDVKTIKISISKIGNSTVDEGLPRVSCRGHVFEFLSAKRPTTWFKLLITLFSLKNLDTNIQKWSQEWSIQLFSIHLLKFLTDREQHFQRGIGFL